MKNLKTKWALLVAMSMPGLAVNSCWTIFMTEIRDGAIAGLGAFTQDTAFDLLDTYFDLTPEDE